MITFSKNKSAFVKSNSKYFVVENAEYNSVFIFNIDVKVVWDKICGVMTIDNLQRSLEKDNYFVGLEDLRTLVENLARCGIINCEQIPKDHEFIVRMNQLNNYIDLCTSKSVPTTLHLEITNKCNLACVHCFHDEAWNSLGLEDLIRVFEELRHSPFVRTIITGGEILLHPNWKEIVDAARRNGFIVDVFSNITTLKREDIDFLASQGVSMVRTSLYGASPVIHDSITQVPGSFCATYNNILRLKDAGVPVAVACTIMNQNFDEVLKLDAMMKTREIPISYSYNIIESFQKTKDIEKLIIDRKKFDYLYGRKIIGRPTKISCNPASYRIAIGHTGDIYACDILRIPIGNIRTTRINDAMRGSELRFLKEAVSKYDPKDCSQCIYQENCTRCPGLVWTKLEQPNRHSALQCVYAKISCGG